MQTITSGHRRLATFLLGLFLSLLAMVTLHDLSHRAKDVACVTTVQCDSAPSGDQTPASLHAVQADCALCQFVHTPFVAVTTAITLVVLLLHLCQFLARECRPSQLLARISPQLRAPPALI